MATGTLTGGRRTAKPPPAPPPPEQRVRRTLWRMRREWTAYLFIAPGVIVLSTFTLAALLFAIWLTFHQWSIIEPETPFVGLDNYRQMIGDEDFRESIINTFYFTGAAVPAQMAIGLLLAVLLNQPIRLRGLFRTMYYLPVVTPFVASAILWKWLYNGDFGLFNYYLLKTNLIDEPLLWLSDRNLAMPSVILMIVWGSVGFSMVVYLAGLQAIPNELYEAAEIDGAGIFARFWYVTIPLLSPTTLFLLVIGIIGSFQVFTQIFVMTQGGPAGKTTVMIYFIYEAAFKFYEMGYASTLAFFLFLMLLVVTYFQLRLFRASQA